MAKERIVSAQATSPVEEKAVTVLRPSQMRDYVGQETLVTRLRIAIEAAKGRGEPVEHVLLHGPPGLGKTTMAHIIASEMETQVTLTSGPALTKPGDLVGILTKLQARDVLFIDEIHRLPIAVEEYLYSAMEDFRIDVKLDSGIHAETITLPLQPFTLIGATTRAGMLSGPMRTRFGIAHNLEFYSPEQLTQILTRSAHLLELNPDPQAQQALESIATRSRGTPRIANRLLRRVRDFAQVKGQGHITQHIVDEALALEGVDALGLDESDRKYMACLADVYAGGPVGLDAIAATLGEDAGTLEQAIEPYLLQLGYLARTRQGRMLTQKGAAHIGKTIAQRNDLFSNE